jgi:hypothetical protein
MAARPLLPARLIMLPLVAFLSNAHAQGSAASAFLSSGGAVRIASVLDDVRVETGGKKTSWLGLRRKTTGSLDERISNLASLVSGEARSILSADHRGLEAGYRPSLPSVCRN